MSNIIVSIASVYMFGFVHCFPPYEPPPGYNPQLANAFWSSPLNYVHPYTGSSNPGPYIPPGYDQNLVPYSHWDVLTNQVDANSYEFMAKNGGLPMMTGLAVDGRRVGQGGNFLSNIFRPGKKK